MTNYPEFRIVRKGVIHNKAIMLNEVVNDTVLHDQTEHLYDLSVQVRRRQTKRELIRLARDILGFFGASYTSLHQKRRRHDYYIKHQKKAVEQATSWDKGHPERANARKRRYDAKNRVILNERRRAKYRAVKLKK